MPNTMKQFEDYCTMMDVPKAQALNDILNDWLQTIGEARLSCRIKKLRQKIEVVRATNVYPIRRQACTLP